MKKEKNVIRFFIDFYRRFSIPWWLYLLSMLCGIAYAEGLIQVSGLLIRVNKGELYNSVILGYVLLSVLNALISFGQNLLQAYGDQRVTLRARKVLWKKVLHLSPGETEREEPSTLISAMTNETEQAPMIISVLFLTVSSVYGMIRACLTLYHYQASLALSMLLLIPLAVLVFFIVGKTQYFIMKKRYASLNEMTSFFAEHISAGKYVKAHSMEEKELESGYRAIHARYQADIYYAFLSALQTFLNSIYTNICTITLAVRGAGLIQKGQMESTGINTFSAYMGRVNQYLAENLTHFQQLMGTKGALSHVSHVLSLPGEDPEAGEEWTEGMQEDIVLEHVRFGYTEDTEIIHDLSIRIPAGKVTALIGDNGCGKSTVLKLIQGFYRPASGNITVAGNEVGKVKLSALRGQFGYVIQNSPVFAGTIRENMTYGLNREVSSEELYAMSEKTCIREFAEKLPEGYDTPVGEGGGRLSGGQRQRLAIARSLMQQPRYLLLDEAGANLDYETYQKIFGTIRECRRNQTIVMIAHDMKEIMEADYMIVLDHGELEDCGTHEELLKRCATYRDYFRQLEKEQKGDSLE